MKKNLRLLRTQGQTGHKFTTVRNKHTFSSDHKKKTSTDKTPHTYYPDRKQAA